MTFHVQVGLRFYGTVCIARDESIVECAIYYWSPEASIAEVDFVVQCKAQVIPMEVKAERNLRAKSLGMFVNRYSAKTAIRTSLQAYEEGNTIVDVPLYGFAWYFLNLL